MLKMYKLGQQKTTKKIQQIRNIAKQYIEQRDYSKCVYQLELTATRISMAAVQGYRKLIAF